MPQLSNLELYVVGPLAMGYYTGEDGGIKVFEILVKDRSLNPSSRGAGSLSQICKDLLPTLTASTFQRGSQFADNLRDTETGVPVGFVEPGLSGYIAPSGPGSLFCPGVAVPSPTDLLAQEVFATTFLSGSDFWDALQDAHVLRYLAEPYAGPNGRLSLTPTQLDAVLWGFPYFSTQLDGSELSWEIFFDLV
ncbi:hypothetical protein BJY04DRAFT_36694 [Aspergillus karnatakaensis]|uniref:uncharacterized protein n=1 Tax=Aspergillus karnatakaensis TaxID=1810916 RepID=UPI003CCD1662